MAKKSFIVELKHKFPETDWPVITSALQSDPRIWDDLQGDFGIYAVNQLPDSITAFSPGALCLLALDSHDLYQNFRESLAQAVPEQLLGYQPQEPPFEIAPNLVSAGLSALHLRERRRMAGKWNFNKQDLTAANRTAFACLYSLVPDTEELTKTIFEAKTPELAVHALLCQPLPPEDILNHLERNLSLLDVKEQLIVFRILSRYQRAGTRLLAPRLDETQIAENGSQITIEKEITDLRDLIFQADIWSITQHAGKASEQLTKAAGIVQRFQALINARLAEVSQKTHNSEASLKYWEQASHYGCDNPDLLSAYVISLIENNEVEAAAEQLKNREDALSRDKDQATLHIARARLALAQGDVIQARQIFQKAMASLEPTKDLAPTPVFNLHQFWHDTAQMLIEIGLPHEAITATKLALQYQVNNPITTMTLARAYQAAGKLSAALEAAHQAIALSPGRLNFRRNLAGILEAAGEWEEALIERSQVLERATQPSAPDLHAHATCALAAGQPDKAIKTCQQALAMDGNDAVAHALVGEALAQTGEVTNAIKYLEDATQTIPQHPAPWLALAKLYNSRHESEKALNTLRAAISAAPDIPELHLALGETYLEQEAYTQALGEFQTAMKQAGKAEAGSPVSPLRLKITWRLGQTRHHLGHLGEARQLLEAAYQSSPAEAQIALSFAKILLELGETQEAIEPLYAAVKAEPEDIAPYLAFVQGALALGKEAEASLLRDGIRYIHKAQEIEPDSLFAQALSAELYAALGEYQSALQIYRQVAESELANDPDWHVRLSLGIGKTALELGQIEAAIAALQEAQALAPTNPQIQMILFEAFDVAGLAEDAFRAAHTALTLTPDDLEMLVWFTESTLAIKDRPGIDTSLVLDKAIRALIDALRIAPQRVDLLVKLGHVHLLQGDVEAAQATFIQLLTDHPDKHIKEDLLNLADASVLQMAAEGFLQLNEIANAILCLENALEKLDAYVLEDESSTSNYGQQKLTILDELANAYFLAGEANNAITTLNRSIELAPHEPGLYIKKANIHINLMPRAQDEHHEHSKIALECLEKALEINPTDPENHLRLAYIHRLVGGLQAALFHAEQATSLYRKLNLRRRSNSEKTAMTANSATPAISPVPDILSASYNYSEVTACVLSGEIARAMLSFERARSYISHVPAIHQAEIDDQLAYHCLRGELALAVNEFEAATEALAQAMEVSPDDPRLLALQSRLAIRNYPQRLDRKEASSAHQEAARETFKTAWTAIQKHTKSVSNELSAQENLSITNLFSHLARLASVAEAALDLRQWDKALEILTEISSLAPKEAFSTWTLAKTLVLRAEFQKLCQSALVVTRSPGEAALSSQAQQAFLNAIQQTKQLIPALPAGSNQIVGEEFTTENTASLRVLQWETRGEAVFTPEKDLNEKFQLLSKTAENAIAQIVYLRERGDLSTAGKVAKAYHHHPHVLAQLALSLGSHKPRQALVAAQAAIETLEELRLTNPTGLFPNPAHLTLDDSPVLYAILAILIANPSAPNENGISPLQAIQTAINIWPDEPAWHILAAEIHLQAPSGVDRHNYQQAIASLEQAIQLDPQQAKPLIMLGQIYLQDGEAAKAIQALESACELIPDEAEPWLLLAKAYWEAGDLPKAAARAERAVTLAPSRIEPLIIRGEIALQENNPKGAQTRAQAALHLQPDDPSALVLMARSLIALDQPVEALEVLEKAIPLASNPLPLLLERVRLLEYCQGPTEALETSQKLAEQYPENPEVLALLAGFLDRFGESETAIQAAQRALRSYQLQDEVENRPLAALHYLLGQLFSRTGQLDQAIHHLTEAIRLDPHHIEAHLELGYVHHERRQHAQALRAYQQAIEIDPADHRAYYQAGLALKDCKDYLEAEKMLKKASDLAPDDLSIHRLLGAVVALNLVHNRRTTTRKMTIGADQNRVAP